MLARKRSASEAQLPTSINHLHKRPYAQTLPSRRNTQGVFLDDAPEGESLMSRWITLAGDTWHALWDKSAQFASWMVPSDSESSPVKRGRTRSANVHATANASTNTHLGPDAIAGDQHHFSRSVLPARPPIPKFEGAGPLVSETPNVGMSSPPVPLPPLVSSTAQAQPRAGGSVPARHKYDKQTHIHKAQHKRQVEEYNLRELERLRGRRTSISDEHDMERTFKNAKKRLAEKEGDKLVKQWEDQKAVGSFHAGLDSFMDHRSYRQMVLDESEGKFSIPASPSLPDLALSISNSSKSRPRLPSTRRSSFNMERTLQIAHLSLNEPRPLNQLSFDKLRLVGRQKDREIEKRIREATRLPTKLPPNVLQEIKLFRGTRGIVSKVGKEQVADVDLSRLDPGGTSHWLNDEIINFYGALIMERSERFASNKENLLNGAMKKRKTKVEYLNIHYFSTFFWPKIEKSYKDTRLNKWTKKFDIFQKDVVLIPINHGNVHWTLAAINFRKKRIESFDSMGVYRLNVYKKLRYYLQEEHMDKKKKPFDFAGWIDYYDEDTPQQENGYDCGVFTCQFMESLSRGVEEFVFDQDDMPYIRDRMTWEIGKSRLWEDSDG